MSRLLTEDLRNALPPLRSQESASDPVVYASFYFAGNDWRWFVTEGEPTVGDFTFFGYVIGFEAEWGYFTLGELEEVNVNGVVVEKDLCFKPRNLSDCLSNLPPHY